MKYQGNSTALAENDIFVFYNIIEYEVFKGADIMVSSLDKNIDLNDYKECSEQFIYGIKGIVRLSIGREIIYRMGNIGVFDFFTEINHIYRIECIFAVTDKRIILIPIDNEYATNSFTYRDIKVIYYNQLFDKVFLLNVKDTTLLNFCENRLIFSMYSKQSTELNKINCILKEHGCA